MNRKEKIALLREHLRQDGIPVDAMSDEEVVSYRDPRLVALQDKLGGTGSYTFSLPYRPRRDDTGGNA